MTSYPAGLAFDTLGADSLSSFVATGSGELLNSILERIPSDSAWAMAHDNVARSTANLLGIGIHVGDETLPAVLDHIVRPLRPLFQALAGPGCKLRFESDHPTDPVLVNTSALRRALTAWLIIVLDAGPTESVVITTHGESSWSSCQLHARITRRLLRGERAESFAALRAACRRVLDETGHTHDRYRPWDTSIIVPNFWEPPFPPNPVGPPWRVLVVERDELTRLSLMAELAEARLAVSGFGSANEAVESMRSDPRAYQMAIVPGADPIVGGGSLSAVLQEESPCTHLLCNSALPPRPLSMDFVLERIDELRRRQRPRVLVVDDEEGARNLAHEILSAEDYDIYTAVDGREAAQLLQQSEFDVMVTDLVMPRREGLSFIHSICQRYHRMRILATSGVKEDYLRAARLMGADAVLSKRNLHTGLRSAVRRLLEGGEERA